MLRYAKSLHSYNPLPNGCLFYLPLWHPNLHGIRFSSIDPYKHTCGRVGGVLDGDGFTCDGNDYLGPGDNSHFDFAGDSSFSIFMWVKISTAVANTLIGKNDYTADVGWVLYTRDSDDNLFCSLNQGEAGVRVNYSSYYDVMTLVGFIKDSTNAMKILINGAEIAYVQQDNGVNVNSPTGYSLHIGGRSDLNADYFLNGTVGEVWAYNRACSVADGLFLYNKTKGRHV